MLNIIAIDQSDRLPHKHIHMSSYIMLFHERLLTNHETFVPENWHALFTWRGYKITLYYVLWNSCNESKKKKEKNRYIFLASSSPPPPPFTPVFYCSKNTIVSKEIGYYAHCWVIYHKTDSLCKAANQNMANQITIYQDIWRNWLALKYIKTT